MGPRTVGSTCSSGTLSNVAVIFSFSQFSLWHLIIFIKGFNVVMKKDEFVGEIVWSKKKKDIFVWSYEMNGALNVRFFKSKIIVLGVERSRMCANSITNIYHMIRW